MSKSAIKGSAFESIVADVNRLVEEGVVSTIELEAELTPEDLRVLESKIQAALWYPLDTFGRLTAIMLRTEGRGNLEYLIERGRRAARRLVESGVYAQLSANQATLGDRVGRVMVTLGPGMYRDTEWEYETQTTDVGARGFQVAVEIPGDFPDLCRQQTLGCIDQLAQMASKAPYQVSSQRDSKTRMSFTGWMMDES